MLRALRASDGHAQWTVPLVATEQLHFQFDAAGALFALDLSSQTPSVRRIDLARGSVAWTHPLAVGGELITEGSTGFVVVRDGPNLVALDKATGTPRWTYPVQNDPSWQSWDVRFMRSGELLVSQRSAKEIPYSGTIGHTTLHTVVSAAGAFRWSLGPHTAVLPVTSGPRTFLWETPAGELYDTTYGGLARLDPTTGDRLWTSFDVLSVDRVIGTDGDLVLVTGPPQSCCYQPEWVRAASKTNGQGRWMMSEQFPMGISLLTSDQDHIFLTAPPDAMYTPSTTIAIWK
jgi:outer membrane protein assembly factor BamB